MILTCDELYNLTENPKINSISLNLLREYYEKYLNCSSFQYEVIDTSKDETFTIQLNFYPENFCHLFGIETILKQSINYKDLHNYKGQLGWNNIQNGTLDFKFLKEKNKKQFLNNKSRFVFFYLVPKLLEMPKGVIFDSSKVRGNSFINCKLLFFDKLQNAYVQIGIVKNESLNCYVPQTFLIEKITQFNDGLKYIGDQQKITVNKIITEL